MTDSPEAPAPNTKPLVAIAGVHPIVIAGAASPIASTLMAIAGDLLSAESSRG